MVDTTKLIEKIRRRKEQLKKWEWWDINPSNLIYHTSAVNLDSPDESQSIRPVLTKPERKRKKRLEKAALREDERKRVALGIDKPASPKLSRRNVSDVFGAAYFQDPTKYEAMAQQAEEERRNAHIARNEERKTTKDQKWEKHQNTVQSHREKSLHCAAIFAHRQLNSKEQYIIDYTAKKFLCTGACLLSDKDAVVIVECGEQELHKILKLMKTKLGCSIIWQGELPNPNFKRWSIHSTPKRWEFLKVYGLESICEQIPGKPTTI